MLWGLGFSWPGKVEAYGRFAREGVVVRLSPSCEERREGDCGVVEELRLVLVEWGIS